MEFDSDSEYGSEFDSGPRSNPLQPHDMQIPIFKRVTPVYVDWSEMGERRTDHQKYFARSNGVDWSETKCHSSVHLTSTDFAETREYCSEHTCADFGEVACENSHWLSHNSSLKIWMRCWAKSARNIKTAARHAQLATSHATMRTTSRQEYKRAKLQDWALAWLLVLLLSPSQ